MEVDIVNMEASRGCDTERNVERLVSQRFVDDMLPPSSAHVTAVLLLVR